MDICVDNKRSCQICGFSLADYIYGSEFASMDDLPIQKKYDIIQCKECGFIFSDVQSSQEDYDNYYCEFSNYDNNWGTSQNTKWIDFLTDIIKSNTKYDYNIVDIGCGTGGILAALKDCGYKNIKGLDISESVVNRLKHIGLDAEVCNIFEYTPDYKYDMIIITEVLEHIKSLNDFMQIIKKLLKHDGLIFVTVPDSSRYSFVKSKPFFSISIEHINYFDQYSLENILGKNGFDKVVVKQCYQETNDCDYPQLAAVFKLTEFKEGYNLLKCSHNTKEDMIRFINHSKSLLDNDIINYYATSKRKISVWGAGVYTQNLLSNSNLKNCDISAIIDNDPKKQGKFLGGIPIQQASYLKSFDGDILVALLTHKDMIKDQIKKMGIKNLVHYL